MQSMLSYQFFGYQLSQGHVVPDGPCSCLSESGSIWLVLPDGAAIPLCHFAGERYWDDGSPMGNNEQAASYALYMLNAC